MQDNMQPLRLRSLSIGSILLGLIGDSYYWWTCLLVPVLIPWLQGISAVTGTGLISPSQISPARMLPFSWGKGTGHSRLPPATRSVSVLSRWRWQISMAMAAWTWR